MGLDALNLLLRQRGFGEVSRKGTPLSPYYKKLRTAFEGAARYVNPRFRFVFIEDGTINGIAYSGLWRSYVGLTFGCVSLLEAVWRLLLRSVHLMQHLPGGETHDALRHDIQTTFHASVVGNDRAEVPDSYFAELRESADSMRAEMSYRLFKRSLLFLFYHELSHLSRGHTKLCQAAGHQPLIHETSGTDGPGAKRSDARPWAELEADKLATIWLLQNEEWHADEKQNTETLFEFFFGVGVVFLIFSNAEQQLGSLSSDHPHPSLRLAHLVETTADFLVDSERTPFSEAAPINAAAEKALEELAIVGVLGGFDWYGTVERDATDARERITSIRMKAGRKWVEAANKFMQRTVKRPPPKI